MSKPTEDSPLITRDWLAIERTRLANERTFLAYFRTGIVFLASGVSILEIDRLSDIRHVGIGLLIIAPFILAFGIARLGYVRRMMRRYYK